jgi:predicted transcriptional regulator
MDPLSAILLTVAQAFITVLIDKSADIALAKLKRAPEPARQAVALALGAAIQKYVGPEYGTTSFRSGLARPLLEKDGFLTEHTVADELTQIVRFQREPNYELLGQRWKAALAVEDVLTLRDFTQEAKLLLGYFESELRDTEIFRPVFIQKTLDAIADDTETIATFLATSATSLTTIERQLNRLADLFSYQLQMLRERFALASPSIRNEIRDYRWYITDKTKGFVGRTFVFDKIKEFTEDNTRGYFIVRGDPGIGKTALVAQLVKTQALVHHFNIRAEGITTVDAFLRNVCSQLIVKYGLERTALTERETRDGGILNTLFEDVSQRIGPGEKAIIVVDALDEADNVGPSINRLYLPVTLPEGIYIVATSRKADVELLINCEQGELYLEPDSAGNIADIREYLSSWVPRQGIQAYITAQRIDSASFMERLIEKSEGNFMYLYHVLPEIERGFYKDQDLRSLPTGLKQYYEAHWRRMRGEDQNAWFAYKLPILMALAVAESPLQVELIADYSEVPDQARVVAMLQEREWGQFLHKEEVVYAGTLQKRYSLYHASFQEFLRGKEEIEAGVSRKNAAIKIAASAKTKLFGNE